MTDEAVFLQPAFQVAFKGQVSGKCHVSLISTVDSSLVMHQLGFSSETAKSL